MAETSGKSGEAGSGYPIFKSEGGAFDRAKFESTIRSGAGSIITPETFEAMKAADSAGTAAKFFYNVSFNKNLRELDPEFNSDSVFYREAYSQANADKNLIAEDIDEGKSVDGKDIFEMSKKSANEKYNNAKILKEGNVTQIIENIGSISEIEGFEKYDSVKSDFDSKIKDEKIKFDVISDKFLDILNYFNQEGASVNAKKLYTPENNAIISAFAKILEGEGFNSPSVLEMSKRYDENLKKLIEGKDGKKAEDVIKEAADQSKKEETATKTEEQKLEEKKSEEPKKESIPENKDVKLDQPKESSTSTTSTATPTTTATVPEEPKKADEKKEPEVKTAEQKLDEKKPEEKKEATGTVEEKKDEGKKGKGKGKEKEPVFSEPVKGIFDMLGIKLPAAKEGEGDKGEGDKGKGKNKGLTTGSAQGDKTMEELGFAKPKEGESGGDKGKKDNKSTTDNKATKLDEKVSTNTDKKSETSTTSTPIKETQTQNLSSVSTPDTDKKDVKKEEPTTTTATTTENQAVDKNTSAINDAKTTTEATKETEDKTKKEDQDKMNKEMSDNMKSMVSLLTQLNNTLKNPLMVIPNNKKFH